MSKPKTFTDLFTTTVILIERNPLVKSMSDVESILQNQFGYKNVTLLDSNVSYAHYNLYAGNKNNDDLLPSNEVRIYRVLVGTESIQVTIENTEVQTSNRFYVTEVLAESIGTSLLGILRDKLDKLG